MERQERADAQRSHAHFLLPARRRVARDGGGAAHSGPRLRHGADVRRTADPGGIPEELAKVGDALLGNLSLLFVPAGVGVMLHLQLMEAEILPISVALIGSTLITVAVTALLMQWLNREAAAPESAPGDPR